MTERFDPGEGPPPTARLRVLATTDLHVHLLPYDYYTDRPLPATGLAQAASVSVLSGPRCPTAPACSSTTATR